MKAQHLVLVAGSVFSLVLLYPIVGSRSEADHYVIRGQESVAKTPQQGPPGDPTGEPQTEQPGGKTKTLMKKKRLAIPPGWKSKGCGSGPPPRDPSLSDLPECAGVIASYEKMCGAANGHPGLHDEYDGIKNASERAAGDPAKYEGKYALVCYSQKGVGHPAYLLAAAIDSRDEPTCGPPEQMFDVLDMRIEGPRSIEYGFESTPVRWFKIITFRPMEAGAYQAYLRVHLQRQSVLFDGWEFKRKNGKRKLALMGSAKCPVSSCGKPKAHFWCNTHHKRLEFNVTQGTCSMPKRDELPLCAESYPGTEDAWFGRWVKECNGDEKCLATHPIKTRPLDSLRDSIHNTQLLRAVGGCGPSIPSKAYTRQYSHFVFTEKAGWVWHPHVCRPRIFTQDTAWRCLNQTGLLNIGDSVQFTNGHLLWLWLDLAPLATLINNTYFSVRGDRRDELFGTVGRGMLDPKPEKRWERFFLYQLVRQRNVHLRTLKSDLDELEAAQTKKNGWHDNIQAVVMSMGLHDAVQTYSLPNQTEMNGFMVAGFKDLKYPVVFHPSPSASIIRSCSRKHNDRVWRVNGVYDRSFNNLNDAGVPAPPIAITPSYFMSKSLSWEVPMMDASGTHPYCSFVGLNMWMQTLDLVCPVDAESRR